MVCVQKISACKLNNLIEKKTVKLQKNQKKNYTIL